MEVPAAGRRRVAEVAKGFVVVAEVEQCKEVVPAVAAGAEEESAAAEGRSSEAIGLEEVEEDHSAKPVVRLRNHR